MIRITRPQLGDEELQAIREVLESGFLVQGKAVAAFEWRIADATGARFAVAVSSGTAALHLALLALAIGPGDEVITSSFSFPATVNVIERVGARPVLVDVDLATFNLRTDLIERAITGATRAILPVHEFGLMADMAAVREIAVHRGLPIIEDAACSLGATQTIDGRTVAAGSAGTFGCFSFHPRKSITTGEGGCLTTNDESLAERARALRNHGMAVAHGEVDFVAAGLNYRLTEMQGAMGTVQMARLPAMIAERRCLARRYDERLHAMGRACPPSEPQGRAHAYQSYVLMLPPDAERPRVIARLRERGVEAVRGAYAVHRLQYYRERYGHRPDAFPAASRAHDSALAVPLYPGMPADAVDTVCDALADALA